MATLATIPSDPMEAFEAKGIQGWLEGYYNPLKFFDKVYLLSPLEKAEKEQYWMHTIPTEPRELPGRLRALGVDIVRAYGGYWPCDMACRNKARGVPVVVSVHDTNPRELYRAIRRADYVLCMSEAVRDLVLTRFRRPDRAWVMPNRVDTQVMRPMPGEKFPDLDARYPWRYRLLCVGRLSEQKNQDTVIRALAELGPRYGCLFVGRNDPFALKRLARELGVEPQCRFVPSIPNEELARYYNWADAMVTPSRWEGFGLVFIEALACGAVVVTSNVRPMSEYISHERTGLLVDAFESPRALAGTIRRACTDFSLREALKRRAPSAIARFERTRVDALEIRYYTRVLMERRLPQLERWVKRRMSRRGGVAGSSHSRTPSAEATAALLPLVVDSLPKRASRMVRWLLHEQTGSDAWATPESPDAESAMATALVVHALLAASGAMPEAHGALRRGCDWLKTQVSKVGRIESPDPSDLVAPDGTQMPETIRLAAMRPLVEAAHRLERPDYAEVVWRALAFYKRDEDLGRFTFPAPYHAVLAEALTDLGEADLARRAMDEAAAAQRDDGAVPVLPGAEWVCPDAVARYARVWLRHGATERACRAAAWLSSVQNPSGGFYGSYGPGAAFYPDTETTRAAAQYLALLDEISQSPDGDRP